MRPPLKLRATAPRRGAVECGLRARAGFVTCQRMISRPRHPGIAVVPDLQPLARHALRQFSIKTAIFRWFPTIWRQHAPADSPGKEAKAGRRFPWRLDSIRGGVTPRAQTYACFETSSGSTQGADEIPWRRRPRCRAFEDCSGAYEPRAYSFFIKRTQSRERAQDLYQELFLRIHRARDI